MRIEFRSLWILLALLVLGLIDLTPAHAGSLDLAGGFSSLAVDPTIVLEIAPLKPVPLGDQPIINVSLTKADGAPIPNQPVRILVDGVRKAQALTDGAGRAVIPLRYKFSSGKYEVEAIFLGSGSEGLARASDSIEMVVEVARTVLRTIPPLPGIRFRFNGHTYVSDEDGEVHLTIQKSGVYLLEVLPIDEKRLSPNTRIEFTRWNEAIYKPYRVVYFPRSRPLEAGFTVSYRVGQAFFDSTGEAVSPSRVSSMTLRAIGRTYIFKDTGLHWLPANNLTRRIGERLQSEDILYYFRDVTINGTNVINKSEQRFYVRPNDIWPVRVLLYSAHFSARDAMFGFPIGTGVELHYPDGQVGTFAFSANREVEISSLARGSYKAMVVGAGGSSPLTPIHLSRDQDAELLVISYLDMTVIFGTPAILALALLFVGRPLLLAQLRTGINLKGLAARFQKASSR
jgi:hypothetical protein